MKVCIISSSPNEIGLTMDCVNSCIEEIKNTKNDYKHFCLNKYNILRCQACGDRGWGICLNEHKCVLNDDFNDLYKEISEYDYYIFITPVYFHEMSESAKTFFDRLKRVDVFNDNSVIKGKKVISIACAGGSGTGTDSTLSSMKILTKFLKLETTAEIGVNKKNKEDKLTEIKNSVREMMK